MSLQRASIDADDPSRVMSRPATLTHREAPRFVAQESAWLSD